LPTGSNLELYILSDSSLELSSASLMEDQCPIAKDTVYDLFKVFRIWVEVRKAIPQSLFPITVGSLGQEKPNNLLNPIPFLYLEGKLL
jgi:hypothetical protein